MFLHLIEGFLRNISGSLGIVLRRLYYKMRLGSCGKNLVVGEGVFLDNPNNIELGDNVWIDRNSVLIAGKTDLKINNTQGNFIASLEGKIILGSNSHIGIGTILQGHGGIRIEDNFTTSAYCKIYSLSNDPSGCINGTINSGNYTAPCILSQVNIEKNVWLGLNVTVLGGSIGANCFIKPNSVVYKSIEENSIAEGTPAVRIKERFEDSRS